MADTRKNKINEFKEITLKDLKQIYETTRVHLIDLFFDDDPNNIYIERAFDLLNQSEELFEIGFEKVYDDRYYGVKND